MKNQMAREKTPECNRGCGQRVWFDWNAKAGDPGRSDFGKLRALQVSEEGQMLNEIHDCPNSTYGKQSAQSGSGGTTTRTTGAAAVSSGNVEAVLGNTMDIIARIEKLETQIGQSLTQIALVSRLLFQISEKIDRFRGQQHINDTHPLDDDGDSQREDPQPDDMH